MKTKNCFSILAATFFALAMTTSFMACDPDDDGPEGPDGPGLYEGSDLKGTITEAISLNAQTTYTLSAPLFVKEGGELIIPAGTTIKAAAGDNYILVEMGGKIFINGTASAPVVMTANRTDAGPGYWGGLIINGKAPLAGGETNVDTEINAAYKYGGTDANDNSGEITFLTLEYTGYAVSSSVEHNGLTLNAVGKGTKIENVYIPNGGDDGIEFFGGSVNVTGLLVVNSDDDMFDFTRGYTGTLKNAYGVWESGYVSSEEDPNGIEADGNFDGNSATHDNQSNFRVENVTFDLQNEYVAGDNSRRMQSGMRIRRHTTATITNALFKGTGRVETLINLSDSKGGANTATSVSVTNGLVTPPDALFKYTEATAADFPGVNIVEGNTGCATSIFSWTGYEFADAPDVMPGALYAGSDLKGDIAVTTRLDASTEYKLSGPLFVKDGATLNIPAGTTIKAAAGDNYILVEMGAMINIAGTAAAPVVMTADRANAGPGYWGGLIINGKAPLAGGETNVDTEINAAYKYGGTDTNDNSGEITYLTLEYTGYAISSSIEHNGLTLNAVGKGTKIENVYIPNGGDDGIEFFGGSVDVTSLLVVNSDDDMFDFTRGYNGTLKDAYGVWESGYVSSEEDPNGIEADGNFDGNSATHNNQSDFNVENVTFDLRLNYVTGDNARRMQSGMRIRRHAKATITNALFKGMGRVETLINLSDSKGGANTATSVSVTNGLVTAPDALFKYTDATAEDFPRVNIVEGNAGCTTSVFGWTGYAF